MLNGTPVIAEASIATDAEPSAMWSWRWSTRSSSRRRARYVASSRYAAGQSRPRAPGLPMRTASVAASANARGRVAARRAASAASSARPRSRTYSVLARSAATPSSTDVWVGRRIEKVWTRWPSSRSAPTSSRRNVSLARPYWPVTYAIVIPSATSHRRLGKRSPQPLLERHPRRPAEGLARRLRRVPQGPEARLVARRHEQAGKSSPVAERPPRDRARKPRQREPGEVGHRDGAHPRSLAAEPFAGVTPCDHVVAVDDVERASRTRRLQGRRHHAVSAVVHVGERKPCPGRDHQVQRAKRYARCRDVHAAGSPDEPRTKDYQLEARALRGAAHDAFLPDLGDRVSVALVQARTLDRRPLVEHGGCSRPVVDRIARREHQAADARPGHCLDETLGRPHRAGEALLVVALPAGGEMDDHVDPVERLPELIAQQVGVDDVDRSLPGKAGARRGWTHQHPHLAVAVHQGTHNAPSEETCSARHQDCHAGVAAASAMSAASRFTSSTWASETGRSAPTARP